MCHWSWAICDDMRGTNKQANRSARLMEVELQVPLSVWACWREPRVSTGSSSAGSSLPGFAPWLLWGSSQLLSSPRWAFSPAVPNPVSQVSAAELVAELVAESSPPFPPSLRKLEYLIQERIRNPESANAQQYQRDSFISSTAQSISHFQEKTFVLSYVSCILVDFPFGILTNTD